MAQLGKNPAPNQGAFNMNPEEATIYQFPARETAQGVSVRIDEFHQGLESIRAEIPRQEQRIGLIKAGKSPRLLGNLASREGDLGKAQDRVENAAHLHNVIAARLRKEFAETAGYVALLDSGMFDRNEVNVLRSRATDAFLKSATREYKLKRRR
jgi:hypothetical protein